MRLLFIRISAVVMFLASILVFDGLLQGHISFLGGLALLPAFAMLAMYMFQLSSRRQGRAKQRHTAQKQVATSHYYTAYQQPQLRVATAGNKPHGPKAA